MADVSISYKNAEIATMNATGVKTLLTGDCFCEDDIVISYTKPAAPTPTLQSKTVSPTTSQQTVSPDSGYDGLSSVTVNAMPSGTAGTPTATKGTVSNHSVTVTPSVTNTSGYISGGTISGTAVTVSASELVSGTKSITENGAGIDVTNYAAVDVNVSGGGGASNIVTGTFTGTSNGSLAIDLGYSGNGYPISYYIFSKEGKRTDTGIVMYAKVLRDTSVAPTYAVASDYSILIYHTTANASMTYSGKSSVVFTHTQAANGINLAAAMSDKTTLNVYIGTGKDNFTVDKEYVYVVVYRE